MTYQVILKNSRGLFKKMFETNKELENLYYSVN